MTGTHGRGRDHVHEFVVVDLAGRQQLASVPQHHARTGQRSFKPPVQHRSAGQHNRRQVDSRRGHDCGRRCLVATRGQDDAVKRVAMHDLNQTKVRQVPIKRGSWAAAAFLNRMHRKHKRQSARRDDSITCAFDCLQMSTVAGRDVAASLSDPDHRFARLHLGKR